MKQKKIEKRLWVSCKQYFVLSLIILFAISLVSGIAVAQEKKEVIFASWGGDYQKAVDKHMFIPFCEKNNIKFITLSPVDYGKIKAMVESQNVEWDIVDLETNFAFRGARLNLFEPIDYSIVKQPGIPKDYLAKYSIPFVSYTTNMAWNYEVTGKKTATTWADFWDFENFKGLRSLQDTPYTNIEIALLADGVSLNDVYPLTDEKIERAFKKLDQIKPHIAKWWNSGSEPAQMLAKGEIGMASTWNTRIFKYKDEGAPLDQTMNQGVMQFASLAIPRGAKNKDIAMKALNFAVSPEAQAGVAIDLGYGPPNMDAYNHIPENLKNTFNTAPQFLKLQFVIDDKFWGSEKAEKIYERWANWKLK